MDFLGTQVTLPLIVSFLTSLLVSVFVFAIGVRVGKERVDRATLRKMYQEIYAHLRQMKDSIGSGRPKEWADYPLDGNNYWPLLRTMEREGTINILPASLGRDLILVEKEFLTAAFHFKRNLEDQLSPSVSDIVEEHVSGATNPMQGSSYVEIDFGFLVLGQKTAYKHLINRLTTERLGINLRLPIENGKISQKYIFSDNIKSGRIEDVVAKIEAATLANEETSKRVEELRRWEGKVSDFMGKVSVRIKDPHPLWETVLGVVGSILGARR